MFTVGRVFSIEAFTLIASWLGIVVELTESTSLRPNDELTVTVVKVEVKLEKSVCVELEASVELETWVELGISADVEVALLEFWRVPR